jgi:23S rRNA pseudouridine2605 synthase
MNVNPETLQVPDADGPDADQAPAKPARKRRSTKADSAAPAVQADAAEAVPAAEPVAEAPAEPAAEDAAPPKPRRRRTTAAKEGADGTVSPDAPAAEAASAAPIEPARRAAPMPFAPKTPVATPVDGPAPVPVDAAAPTPIEAPEPAQARSDAPAQSSSAAAEEGGAQAAASDAADESDGDGDGSAASDEGRGERGRRRGRRDRRDRADRPEGAPPAAQPARPPAEAGELFAQVLSGQFDVEDTSAPAPEEEAAAAPAAAETEGAAQAPKRVLQPEPDAPKLHKVLAQSGIGSRRDMEDLIVDGHVTVNGEVAHVGQRVSFGDRVQVNGKPVKLRIVPPAPRIIAYHKPVGEIVTHDDPQNRPTVFRRLPRLQQGKWQSVGRLDINTEGLLLFTNSGELANQLMHPRFGVEREYAVRVLGQLSEEDKGELLAGVDVEGQKASFRSIEEGGGDGANHWYRVVITEGRNREVRKLFDAVGLTVSRLIRIRYGTIVLPLGLKRGVWCDLEENDVRSIRRLTSGQQQPPRDARNNNGEGQQQQARGPRPERSRPNERGNDRPNDRPNNRPPRGPANSFDADAPPRERERDENDPDADLDFDPSSIPNPLEQTFDKRFVQNPRTPPGGRGFGRGGGGFGAGGSAPAPSKPQRGPGPKQPDPLQTSLGFMGADAYHRKNRGGGGGGGGGGGNSGGGGGGGGNKGGGNRGFGGGRRGR